MSESILVVDDDFGMRETMIAVLQDAGYEVTAVITGEAGLEAYQELEQAGKTPQAVLIDLLLPKMSGFDFARELKSLNCTAKLIMMSGVFKTAQHKEEAQNLGAKFLQKPFAHEVITQLLGSSSGEQNSIRAVAKEPMPAEGSLLDTPALHLLWRAAREAHTGILDLIGYAPLRARIFVFKGRATFVQHSEPTINLGIELIRKGSLSAEAYQKALELTVEQSLGLHDVIKNQGWADDHAIRDAYRRIGPQLMSRCVTINGRFRWTDTAAFSSLIPAAPFDIMPAVYSGLRQASVEELASHVEPRGPLRLSPGENWDDMTAELDAACGSSSLARSINGRATIAQLISVARNEEDKAQRMRQLFLLLSTQAVHANLDAPPTAAPQPAAASTHQTQVLHTPPADAPVIMTPPPPTEAPVIMTPPPPTEAPVIMTPPPPTEAPVIMTSPPPATSDGLETLILGSEVAPVAPAAPSTGSFVDNIFEQPIPQAPTIAPSHAHAGGGLDDSMLSFRPEDEEARQSIMAKFDTLKGMKHWDVLGLSREESANPGTLKKAYFALARDWHTDRFSGFQLGSAQRQLDNIFAAISDAYSVLNNPGKRAEYEAEVNAEEAGISQDLGALLEAEQDFSKGQILLQRGELMSAAKLFEKALSVNATNLEWEGYFLYANWWSNRRKDEAEKVIQTLEKTFRKMPGLVDLLYFQGRLYMEIDNLERAEKMFRKCLNDHPNHTMCIRDKRTLMKKIEEAEKKKKGLGRFLRR